MVILSAGNGYIECWQWLYWVLAMVILSACNGYIECWQWLYWVLAMVILSACNGYIECWQWLYWLPAMAILSACNGYIEWLQWLYWVHAMAILSVCNGYIECLLWLCWVSAMAIPSACNGYIREHFSLTVLNASGGKKTIFYINSQTTFLYCTKLKTFWLSALAFTFTCWFLLSVGKIIYCHKPVKDMCIFELWVGLIFKHTTDDRTSPFWRLDDITSKHDTATVFIIYKHL
jgi:hypothetical protein